LEEIDGWARELDALHARIAPRIERAEPRRRARCAATIAAETLGMGVQRS
jgi:hypothetical protein